MKPKSPPYAEFARRLFVALKRYELRAGREMDQKALAKAMSMSTATVSNWFTGKQMPSVEQLEAIAKKLDANHGWLAFGDQSEFMTPDNGEPRSSPSQPESDRRQQAKPGRKR